MLFTSVPAGILPGIGDRWLSGQMDDPVRPRVAHDGIGKLGVHQITR